MFKLKKTTKSAIKKRFVEILVIVFSITISIWLNNLNENRKTKKEVSIFLKELKTDLANDLQILNDNFATNQQLIEDSKFLLSIDSTMNDSIIGPHTTFAFTNTDFNVATYDGFKSSGKISTISDAHLKNKILIYYQQMIPGLTKASEFEKYLQLELLNYGDNMTIIQKYKSPKVNSMLINLKHNLVYDNENIKKTIVYLKDIVKTIEHTK